MKSLKVIKRGCVFLGATLFFSGALFLSGRYVENNSVGEVYAINLGPKYLLNDAIPAYPGVLEYSFGEDLRVNDVPVRISYFYTKDPPEKIASFYMNKLKQAGKDPLLRENSADSLNVYSLDMDNKSQINISINQERGRTFVIPAIIPISGNILNDNSLTKEKLMPFSEDAIGILHIDSAEEAATTLSYIEPNFDLDTATGYIRDRLGKDGWNLEQYKPNITEGGAVLLFTKKAVSLSFLMSKCKESTRGVTVIVNKVNAIN